MKKIFLAITVLTCVFFSANFVLAETTTSNSTSSDLVSTNPGILPTSPFYFLKEFGRSIQNFFTTNQVQKAELTLKFANERAAEIKKLEEVAPKRVDAISQALKNYQNDVNKVKDILSNLKNSDANKNVENLLTNLADRAIVHNQLFNELQAKFATSTEISDQVKNSQEKVQEVISKVSTDLKDKLNVDDLKSKIESILKNPVSTSTIKVPTENTDTGFCGTSSNDSCTVDSDCVTGGCSGQVCSAKSAEPKMTTCEWRDCYKKPENVGCGCVNNKCAWNSKVSGICPLYNMAAGYAEKCKSQNGYIKTEKLSNGCDAAPKCILPSDNSTSTSTSSDSETNLCVSKKNGDKLGWADAKSIAANSDCLKQGSFTGKYYCNEETGTWWADLSIQKQGCSPACVIDVSTKKAEINWRCTGLISTPNIEVTVPGY